MDETTAPGPFLRTRAQLYHSKAKTESKFSVLTIASATTITSSSLSFTFPGGKENLSANGRADDCADESIVSASIAENRALNGFGKNEKTSEIKLQVRFKTTAHAEELTFARVTTTKNCSNLSAFP